MRNIMPLAYSLPLPQGAHALANSPMVLDAAADFGAVGDGVTDNATALMALRRYMDENAQYHYDVHFPTGHYVYTNNTWLNNVRSVTVFGNGSTFQSIDNSGGHIWRRCPLYGYFPWEDAAADSQLVLHSTGGAPQAKFERAEVGERVLTLLPEVVGEPYLPIEDMKRGDEILIWAYDQQFANFPPNLRYFEWNKIQSIDAGAGTMMLEFGLKHTYEADLRDLDYLVNLYGSAPLYCGGARFFKLNRPKPHNKRYADYVELRDMVFKKNEIANVKSNLFFPCREWRLKNIVNLGGDLWGGGNEIIVAEDCQFNASDIDKIIGTCIIRRCEFQERLKPASGVENYIVEDCNIRDIFQTAARHTRITGCTIGGILNGAAMRGQALASIRTIIAERNRFTSPSILEHSLRMDTTVPAIVPTSVAANIIRLASTKGSKDIMQVVDTGTLLVNDAEQLAVRVGRIWYDNATDEFVLETDMDPLPAVNWTVVHGQDLIVRNNVRIRPGFPHRQAVPNVYAQIMPIQNGTVRVTPLMDVENNIFPLRAFVRSLTAHVVRPQRNPPTENPKPVAMIGVRQGGSNGTKVVAIDMPLDVIGSTTVIAEPFPVYADTFRVALSQKAYQVRGLSNPDSDGPILHIDIEAEPLG